MITRVQNAINPDMAASTPDDQRGMKGMTVLDSHVALPGLSFRRARLGPEQELVDWFLERDTVRPCSGERVTIFREPRLASGSPELVGVVWKNP